MRNPFRRKRIKSFEYEPIRLVGDSFGPFCPWSGHEHQWSRWLPMAEDDGNYRVCVQCGTVERKWRERAGL